MEKLGTSCYIKNGWWYCSLKNQGKEIGLVACKDARDRRLCLIKMLRVYDIFHGDSDLAKQAREEYKTMNRIPLGKIRTIF